VTKGKANVYFIQPRLAGSIDGWKGHFERAAGIGFSHVCAGSIFASARTSDPTLVEDYERADSVIGDSSACDAINRLANDSSRFGLRLILDMALDRIAATGASARARPDLFFRKSHADMIDPRQDQLGPNALPARYDHPERAQELVAWFAGHLIRAHQAGAVGFRLLGLARTPAEYLSVLTRLVRREGVDCEFYGWTPGLSWSLFPGLEEACLDAVFASTPWWNGRDTWFVDEYNALRRVAPRVMGMPEAPYEERVAARTRADNAKQISVLAVRIAAATGYGGILVPMGFEFGARQRMSSADASPENFARIMDEAPFDLADEIRAANALAGQLAARGAGGEMRSISGPASTVTALLRSDSVDVRYAQRGVVSLINTSDAVQTPPPTSPLPPSAGAAFASPQLLGGGDYEITAPLAAGEVRLIELARTKPVVVHSPRADRLVGAALKAPRIAFERLTPAVDGGTFPVKRVVGETITVEVDVITDGHDIVAGELLWKAADEKGWTRAPLKALGNDRMTGAFTPSRVGRHLFTVEAWHNDYASLAHEIELKHQAGVNVAAELIEARRSLEALYSRGVPCNTTAIGATLATLSKDDVDASIRALIDPATMNAVSSAAERAFCTQHEPITLEVERPQAAFASWYELFPRSQSGDPQRHGTFDDVIARLPDIRRMGFDVLYFPPIHPIGTTNRKGRNNTLASAADDLGSPYAIGSPEGGHDAIHPQLGTLEDFRRLLHATRENGLEIALDFAIQCSPDHPWLRDHPEWFNWRADGSIKYAENPPKKYEDIVNVDFYGSDTKGLWAALRNIVLYWAGQGVRIFRVDNPHTKPLPFWEWMIAEVRAMHPDVIFLSEAFTRPKMMYRLAKLGFSQSYTYFTWRNTKRELTDYLTELTTTEVKEFFRPHFFVNTPDINPYFLQTSGRAGFLIRTALAATLSGLWGVYSGFELCESAPLPGREEYLDSEKYQLRVRDQNVPGNIVSEIAVLNRLRRAHPALQSHLGIKFYNAYNDHILLYGKMSPPGDEMILIAVSLDPHHVQEATFELPLWEWKLADHGSLWVEDLLGGHASVWSGKFQRLWIDPEKLPYAIWRLMLPERAP
jgi:starch synthase (maltosyl-transferring)